MVTVTVSPAGEGTIEVEATAPLWLVDIDGCVCAADEDVDAATCPPGETGGWLAGVGLCVTGLMDGLAASEPELLPDILPVKAAANVPARMAMMLIPMPMARKRKILRRGIP